MKERVAIERASAVWGRRRNHPAPLRAPAWLGRAPTVVERCLARRTGAVLAAMTAGAFFGAVMLEERLIDLRLFGFEGANSVGAVVGSLFLAANIGMGLVLAGVAAVAMGQSPVASLVGLGWLLISHTVCNLYNLIATPEVCDWICGLLGVRAGNGAGGLVVGGETVRAALIFYQDVTQMIGGVVLGEVTLRLGPEARPSGYLLMSLAAWSLFDLIASAVAPLPVLHWSDVAFSLLCGIQGAVCAAWFWRRRLSPAVAG